jgi:hypothetical protein
VKRSFRDFEKMARVVIVTKNPEDFVETTRIFGPYETVGVAQAMLTRYGGSWLGTFDDFVDGWIEETEPVVWRKVDTDPAL